jgi:predicted 3-demethylubiquinone-9 3-methyltransferase (glyoxalase superfamily)
VGEIARCGDNEIGGAPGSVRTLGFTLFGQSCLAVNGGPHFAFNDGVSFVIHCDTQTEIDRLWEALTADGGQPVQCGWLKDRFGLPWQIVPRPLSAWMRDPDPARAERLMQAIRGMVKLDLDVLRRIYGQDGKRPAEP